MEKYRQKAFSRCLTNWMRAKALTFSQMTQIMGPLWAEEMERVLQGSASPQALRRCLNALDQYGLLTHQERVALELALSVADQCRPAFSVTLTHRPGRVELALDTLQGRTVLALEDMVPGALASLAQPDGD